MGAAESAAGGVRGFFAGGRFAAFMLAALLVFYALLAALVFWPAGDGAIAGFADGFRRWCLATDASGNISTLATAALVGEPLVLGAVVVVIWWRPLGELLRTPRRLVGSALAAVVVVAVVLGALGARVFAADRDAGAAEAFPGARIRTAVPAPALELVGHDGRPVTLAALRGRVVLITAVYSSCGTACPMIMAQIDRVLAALDEPTRAELVLLAVTLDPERDDVGRLAAVAEARGLVAPGRTLLTGPPARVNAVLDAFGFERRRDPETGIIDHASLFVVVDHAGRVAYRFTLGERQERWLAQAITELTRER